MSATLARHLSPGGSVAAFPGIVAFVLAAFLAPSPARADLTDESYGAVVAEGYTSPEIGGHGAVIVGTNLDGLPRDATLHLVYNTDTLVAGVEGLELDAGWSAGARLKGQYQFANLLTHYWVLGQRVPDRDISASTLGGKAWFERREGEHLFVRFETSVDRWIVQSLETTSPQWLLHPDVWLVRPRMRVTWWDLEWDPAHTDDFRFIDRTRGFAAGFAVGIDHRSRASNWGALDGRNAPSTNSGVVTQWAKFGIAFASRWRFEFFEEAGWMTGADDLTRRQVGGMNPWVVRVSGAPWTSFLAGRWLSGGVRQRVEVVDQFEVGIVVDGAVINDPRRAGATDTYGGIVGMALEADWRFDEAWQVEGSFGFSPDTGYWAEGPHFGALFSIGRGFSFAD